MCREARTKNVDGKDLFMTRESAEKTLKNMGIEAPTKEQIDTFLNTLGAETKREKDANALLKEQADKATELQKQLDELSSKGLSDLEKAQKATETANAKIAELEKKIAYGETMNKLAECGITGDTAKKLVNESGVFDISVLGEILSSAKAQAAAAKEAELAGKAGNPGSGSSNGSGETLEEGAQMAALFNARYETNK